MMLANVFTKSIRDRRIAVLFGALGVISVAVLGLAAYADLDAQVSELWGALPEAFLTVLGLQTVTNTGTLILGEVANLMAPLIFAGLAISMGAAAVAGEERKGTLGILLGNPKSRQSVVVAKAAAMTVLVTLGLVVSGIGSVVTARLYGTDTSGLQMGAAMVHVAAIALFFGFLALFLGSWTGNSSLASGTATGVLLVSFLAAGLLPLVERLADLAKIFPWYYFNSSRPLTNGIDWGHLAVLGGAIILFLIGAVAGVGRRDLKIGSPSGTLMAKLKEHPLAQKLLRRMAGEANVSSILAKTTADSRLMTTIAAATILYVAILVGPMYNGISGVLVDLSAAIPEALRAMIGFVDMATPEGWYTAEVFSITVPAALIAVGAVLGGRALAGEEENHTMDLLLANPVPRRRIVLEKAASLAFVMLMLGVATFIGVWLGSIVGGLGLSPLNIAGISLLGALLGIVFGCMSLAVGAGTGSRRLAASVTAGVAFVAYFANAFLPVSANLAGWARISPFYYFIAEDPLANGVVWTHAVVLVVLSVALVSVAIPLFQRRDLRG